jgi:hypothetical protein
MTSQRKTLADFTVIIGVLTLILAVSALAEKSHEAHLPERNGRGPPEAFAFPGVLVGILLVLSSVSGIAGNPNRYLRRSGNKRQSGQSCCPTNADYFAMGWPMR